MPEREFSNSQELEDCLGQSEEIIIDGFENLTERPEGYEDQRVKYSGKKSTHTDIALLFSDKERRIYYVSPLYAGSQVDIAILKNEFTPGGGWFRNLRVLFDLGFVGVDKHYDFKELVIGEKRPRKSKKNPSPQLSDEQKQKNKTVSKGRIFVEHAIGRMKKYRILKNRCRLKSQQLKNRILGICAGLSNYQLELTL